MSAGCGGTLATAVACRDSTLNLLTSWPFSFIFSGGRSPALEFWLPGCKSNIRRGQTDSSHDRVASPGMRVASRPQGCAGRRPVNAPGSFCSQRLHVPPGSIEMYIPSSSKGLPRNGRALAALWLLCQASRSFAVKLCRQFPFPGKINGFSSPRQWVETPSLFSPASNCCRKILV